MSGLDEQGVETCCCVATKISKEFQFWNMLDKYRYIIGWLNPVLFLKRSHRNDVINVSRNVDTVPDVLGRTKYLVCSECKKSFTVGDVEFDRMYKAATNYVRMLLDVGVG